MLLKLLFLVIFIQVIFGKEEATLGEFPWTVSLRLSGFVGHDCGGAILNSVIILQSYFVLCFQSCSDLLREENVSGSRMVFFNSSLKAENLQNLIDP
jgi:hypothetical protein